MPLDDFPEDLVIFDRDENVRRYQRDYQFRSPAADVGENTQPWVDANTIADHVVVLFHDARVIAKTWAVRRTFGERLDLLAEQEGVGERLPAVGASGFGEVDASVGGGTIYEGDIAVEPTSKLRFECTKTDLYLDGSDVPLTCLDTGEGTNLPIGTVLQWTNPRPGIGPKVTVVEQTEGVGLTGGHAAETDVELQDRIIDRRTNPPASGNDAAIREAVRKTQLVAVEEVFTHPAIKGPGTTGVTFTVRAALGESRKPSAAQLTAVEQLLKALFPGDDGYFLCSILSQPVSVILKANWARGAAGWADPTLWPLFIGGDPVIVDNAVPISALSFRVTTGTNTTTPQVGQTIAVYNATTKTFSQKRISGVTVVVANRSWTLTFDATNNASDGTYAPSDNQIVSPWSASLPLLVPSVLGHFAKLGPGEQVATFVDPGVRQRRQAESPAKWPNVLTNRLIGDVLDNSAVADAIVQSPTLPYTTTVGTPGVQSYLLELADLAVFPYV